MHQSDHAQAMVDRFRELVEASGDSLSNSHYDELKLIIEAGLDVALLGTMEKIASRLDGMAHGIRQQAEFFD
ncbi:MAG: phosphatase [Gammaproteobacteria bacterium]